MFKYTVLALSEHNCPVLQPLNPPNNLPDNRPVNLHHNLPDFHPNNLLDNLHRNHQPIPRRIPLGPITPPSLLRTSHQSQVEQCSQVRNTLPQLHPPRHPPLHYQRHRHLQVMAVCTSHIWRYNRKPIRTSISIPRHLVSLVIKYITT